MGGVVEQSQPVEAILDALRQRDAGAALVAVAEATAAGRDPRSLGEVLDRPAARRVPRRDEGTRPSPPRRRHGACRGARCGDGRRRAHPRPRGARRGAGGAGQEAGSSHRAGGLPRPPLPSGCGSVLRRDPRSPRTARAWPEPPPLDRGPERQPAPGAVTGVGRPMRPVRSCEAGADARRRRTGDESPRHQGGPRPSGARAWRARAGDFPTRGPAAAGPPTRRARKRRGPASSTGSRGPPGGCSGRALRGQPTRPRAHRPEGTADRTAREAGGRASSRRWRRSSGVRWPTRLVVDATEPPAPAADDRPRRRREAVDVRALEDAPAGGTGVDRLAEAFPGAELVEE